YGARVSLTIGIFATALALLIGVFMGSLSGFFAGKPLTLSIGLLNPAYREFVSRNPLPSLLKTLLWLALWGGLAWLVWVMLSGFWATTRGFEAVVFGIVGVGILLAIAYAILFPLIKIDLDTLIMRTTEI
ncbi:ABC transporter permease, partial [Helicobacter pylori]